MLKPVCWEEHRAIPRAVATLLDSLRLSATPGKWPACSESEWKAALYFADRHQLTLLLQHPGMPADVQTRLQKNRERVARLKQTFFEMEGVLQTPFLVLKGFANWERFTPDPMRRLQYDLDLFFPRAAEEARSTISRLGYETIGGTEQFPTDHLPALVRKTGWQWRGDFYDPDMPLSIDLHFRLWDEATEGFAAPGIDEFWSRRVARQLDGRRYFALDDADALAYSSLHLLRHLLRGDVRGINVYELAWFLHRNAGNEEFWKLWRTQHNPDLRRLQALCFGLAYAWFDCRLSPVAHAEIEDLPRPIERWLEQCAASPVESLFRPNKDELLLHMYFLHGWRQKAAVLRRRLLPVRLPGPLDSVFIPGKEMTLQVRLRKRWQYARYVAGRGLFHARALLPTLSRMARTRLR